MIERAAAAGIERLLVPGYDLASSRAAVELAAAHPDLIRAAVGVHPHHAAGIDEAGWAELEALAREEDVVAVGEIGLDFFRNLSPPDVQRAAFSRQLDLAADVRKPVLVHDRDAHEDITSALLAWQGPGSEVRGVLHAFSGDAAMASSLIEVGYLVSFALPLRFRSAVGPRAAARELPAGTYLVETDSPWLAPGGAKARNEPTTALRVAAELSRLRSEAVEEVVRSVRDAYERLVAPQAQIADAEQIPPAAEPMQMPDPVEDAAATPVPSAGRRQAMGIASGVVIALAVVALLLWLLVLQGGSAAA